jgi:glycosyltransferase involved in cell wall biosynthesis
MNIRSIARSIYFKARLVWKIIRYNYYLKNWKELNRNRELLAKARTEQQNNTVNKNPLISVRIPTYNRANILAARTIPSVLKQTYQNFEIIVVGDNCTDNTEQFLKEFNDERIKFYNLPKRGDYPANPHDRWMVAGVAPLNKGTELSSGDWIAPLDDDDEFSEDHLEVLLNFAIKGNYEMVYGIIQMEMDNGDWINVGSYPLKYERICHLAVLYHKKLKFLQYDINAWQDGTAADWHLWRRMKEAGVRIGFLNRVLGKHYLEGTQRGIKR